MGFRFFLLILICLLSSNVILAQRIKNDTSLSTGIKTKRETSPSHYHVTWIEWDSDFRKSDLRIGDKIIGLNGVRYREDEFTRENLGLGIGDYIEDTYWQRRNAWQKTISGQK